MILATHPHRIPRSRRLAVLLALCALLACVVVGGPSVAQEVLTNDSVISMVRAGLSEGVIIQKIRTSQRKFDTSSSALVQLKGAGVPDRVIEAMMSPPGQAGPPSAPQGAVAAPLPGAPAGPAISHVSAAGDQLLKSVYGNMQIKVEPFSGSRQEVVLQAPRAEYRITDKEPVFSSPQGTEQWILARLKPGKKDRNLPMNKNSGWGFGGATFQHGVDPKYVIKLAAESGPRGIQLKPTQPLAPGEYGFVAVTRGQPNMVEVWDFGVD